MVMYIVSYDISSNRLRNKVAKLLEGYGRRVQYSVFECEVSEKHFYRLRKDLTDLLTGSDDAGIRIYDLCGKCEKKIQIIGVTHTPDEEKEDDVFII